MTIRAQAQHWFETLRDRIRDALVAIEREMGSDAVFEAKSWDRTDHGGAPGGGGVMSLMRGKVFEKAGVNVSTVYGAFDPKFAGQINGASADKPEFFATGISLVIHPMNPRVPAVHLNTRYLETTLGWFGGTTDLNPSHPIDDDVRVFHAALEAACAAPPGDYPAWKAWADEYYFVTHRGLSRGHGGIFFDHLDSGDRAADFAVTRAIGEAFLAIYPAIVRRRMREPFGAPEREEQARYRSRYAEFNLLIDRGTIFGLKTGGNIEAILMSLPPTAAW